MARFVARFRSYSHGVRPGIVEHIAPGQTRPVVRELEAKFDHRGLTEYEKEVALQKLRFPGLPEDKDTRTDVSPISRLSVFDSERARKTFGWSEEEEALVVQTLRESHLNGVEFFEVEQPKRPIPWNGYDELEIEKVLEAVEITGINPAEVLAYERENQAREELVLALAELAGEDVDEQIVVQA